MHIVQLRCYCNYIGNELLIDRLGWNISGWDGDGMRCKWDRWDGFCTLGEQRERCSIGSAGRCPVRKAEGILLGVHRDVLYMVSTWGEQKKFCWESTNERILR